MLSSQVTLLRVSAEKSRPHDRLDSKNVDYRCKQAGVCPAWGFAGPTSGELVSIIPSDNGVDQLKRKYTVTAKALGGDPGDRSSKTAIGEQRSQPSAFSRSTLG